MRTCRLTPPCMMWHLSGPWDYYIHSPGNERSLTDWGDNSLFMYVQMADNADMAKVSAKIHDIKAESI